MDTSSVVKAVRLDNNTVQRITAHMERLQALWGPAVWVNENMALRDVILKGLDVVEGVAEQVHVSGASEETAIAPEAAMPQPSPPSSKTIPAHLRTIAEAYPQATHLSLDEFAEML